LPSIFSIRASSPTDCTNVSVPWDETKNTADKILHHIIALEIHHIGQLSIWSRELELQPASANFVGRELKSLHSYWSNGCDSGTRLSLYAKDVG
jgi:hypothetical protein